ncbi:hypothetical protein C0J50_10348, partial [Silurus asotus]
CKLSGEAQEACCALTLEQSLDYATVKATVLRAYERVPKAYRQNFRNTVKSASQTYVEFAREKTMPLDKWCSASGVSDFSQVIELILLEEFKSCLPEQLVVHLNEQKIDMLAKAAIFSDEFVLTHKVVFSPPSSRKVVSAPSPASKSRTVPSSLDGYVSFGVGQDKQPAQQRKLGDVVDLSVSFLSQEEPVEESSKPLDVLHEGSADKGFEIYQPVTRDQLVAAQKSDPSLTQCFELAANQSSSERYQSIYCIEDGVLMRKWSPIRPDDRWLEVFQLVVPCLFRKHVLSLANDHPCLGPAGIRKTYQRILRYFFWPGIKSDVIRSCKTCHTCQIVGKLNQVVPPAPLNPIVVSTDPFEGIIVDCVGTLPKTSSDFRK